MKYIVNKTAEIVKRHIPSTDGEAMIKINGFEDIRFYENLAFLLSDEFSNLDLTIDIKLAKKKWDDFSKESSLSSYLQSLKQHGWVAENESITRYRNLHKSNLLILMGTELEEDIGGLQNCYPITAETIAQDIDGDYCEVFYYLNHFSDSDKEIINKLYRDLFSYVPVDICKLSNIADKWEVQIDTIKDFVKLFFETLDEWGLPKRVNNLPTSTELQGRKNVLELENKFITRSLFKKMTMKQYGDYEKKLDKYVNIGGVYGPTWDGWHNQEIKSYNEFKQLIMEYARGENVSSNRTKFEKTDFDIVASILDIKIDTKKHLSQP